MADSWIGALNFRHFKDFLVEADDDDRIFTDLNRTSVCEVTGIVLYCVIALYLISRNNEHSVAVILLVACEKNNITELDFHLAAVHSSLVHEAVQNLE